MDLACGYIEVCIKKSPCGQRDRFDIHFIPTNAEPSKNSARQCDSITNQ